MSLQNKIDFAIIFTVKNANPNGDPLNGNRPRTDYEGFGEVTDVCLKRKIRDRLQDSGQLIFVQSDEKKIDGMTSLKDRAESDDFGLGKKAFNSKSEETAKKACKKWFDVRAFGQLFAFKAEKKGAGISIPIRGPVSIQSAFSIERVTITSTQITKSVNGEGNGTKNGEGNGTKKGSDTMGMKHRVVNAVYVAYGAISPQLAERTGFSNDDADILKSILPKLFEGDASSARPEGSMEVTKVVWWKHNSKSGQYSSGKVHRSLYFKEDGNFEIKKLDGLEPELINGF